MVITRNTGKSRLHNGRSDISQDELQIQKPARANVWRRNLYEKTGLPDNFAPDNSFLAAIQRNKNVRRWSFAECLIASSHVTLQICAALNFIYCYIHLGAGDLAWSQVLMVSAFLAIFGFLTPPDHEVTAKVVVKHLTIFLSFGLGLSPVLSKLTDTISTDTIHTTAAFMLLLHLFFHNYNSEASAAYSSTALSLNAALFSAVCLASRLNSSQDGFALLTLSVIAFALFPIWRMKIPGAMSIPTAFSASLAAGALGTMSVSVWHGLAVWATLAAVMLVAPGLFVRWQNYKDTIHGPWDEAVPNL